MTTDTIAGPLAGYQCKHCTASTRSSRDAARMLGWRMFTGVSVTGKPLDDVVCPRCAGTAELEPPSWRVRCTTCDWEAADDDGWDEDGPLTAIDAKLLARSHECMPMTEIAPPDSKDWYHPSDVTDSGQLRRPKTVTVDLSVISLPGVRP